MKIMKVLFGAGIVLLRKKMSIPQPGCPHSFALGLVRRYIDGFGTDETLPRTKFKQA